MHLEDGALIEVIGMIRDLTFDVDSKKYKPHSLWKLKYALGNFKQTKEMSLASYNFKFYQ